jgi:hypothetical protein
MHLFNSKKGNLRPNPDKPELKIEELILKICCIARAAQALAPRVALSFQIKSIAFLSEP